MKKNKIYQLILLSSLILSMCACNEEEVTQPNIVFVFADQLRSQEVSCYGGQNVKTPNMDRIAAEGVRMSNAISTYPICSPFRGMLLTGLYPMNSGITNNDHPLRSGLPSFAEACNDAGYQTAYIGKWHIDGRGRKTYIPKERRLGYKFFQALECTHSYFHSKYYDNDNDIIQQWPGYDAEAQTQSAIDYIHVRDKEKPFFMVLSWGPPHGPYIAPSEFLERVNPDSLILRPNIAEHALADELVEHPRFNIPEIYEPAHKQRILDEMEDEAAMRKNAQGYYAATLAIDQYLGMLMDALEAEGIDDNTIIVFTADHGDQLASHRFYDKSTPFEESISIPLLMKYSKQIAPKTTSDALIRPIDIMPTVMGFAGVEIPEVDGVDRHRVILSHEKDTCDAVLLMSLTHFNNTSLINGMDNWRGVRTKRYTYARYEDQTPWMLFDNQEDPYQMHNLVHEPSFEPLLVQLNERLDILLMEANDNENTKELYDRIYKENPKRMLLKRMREDNPGKY